MTDTEDRDQVNSLVRGLDVIRAFARGAPSMTLSETAGLAGLNRAAARRFLLTLVKNDYAGTNGKLFWLRPKVLELGFAGLASISLSEFAQPVMDDLLARFGETIFLAVLAGHDVVYVARALIEGLLGRSRRRQPRIGRRHVLGESAPRRAR